MGLQSDFDVLILGGGISGMGIAVEASRQGLRCALVEKNSFISQTSASSLRIIHGGFRYLQTLDIPRVIESIKAQSRLLMEYPGLIQTLPCVMPLKKHGLKSHYPVQAASLIYNCMHKFFDGRHGEADYRDSMFVDREIPLIRDVAPYGLLYWNDALLIDLSLLTRELQMLAQKQGVELFEHSEALGLIPCGDFYRLDIQKDGQTESLRGRCVVNALGPWIERIKGRPVYKQFRWCKGFNVILKRQIEKKYAIGLHGEGRLYFIVPRGEQSVIGTEYLPYTGDPSNLCVHDSEVEDFLSAFNKSFPSLKINFSDVDRVEAGVLPMKGMRGNRVVLYGLEKFYSDEMYIEVLSTKFTTFHQQAAKIVGRIRGLMH